MMEQISKYVSYKEATRTNTGVTNCPDNDTIGRMIAVASAVFDPVREHFGVRIGITSFYRSPLVNRIVKGAAKSQHVRGEAIDIDADVYLGGVTNAQIFQYIKDNLEYSQLIWEFGNDEQPDWVHVSYSIGKNKKQVLRSYNSKGGTIYKAM